MSWKMLFVPLLMLSATSCVRDTIATAPRVINTACLIFTPITFSRIRPDQVESVANMYDTDDTAAQVERYDVIYERTCPQPAPAPAEPPTPAAPGQRG